MNSTQKFILPAMQSLQQPNWILALLFGFSVAFPLDPLSRIAAFDILAIGVCIVYLKTLSRSGEVRSTLWLLLAYIGAIFLSVVIFDLPLLNFVRRAYSATFLMVGAWAIYALFARSDLLRAYMVILSFLAGYSLHYFYPVDERVLDQPIKFLLGVPLGAAIGLLFGFSEVATVRTKVTLTFCIISYALFCILEGSRATGGTFAVTAASIWLKTQTARKANYKDFFPVYLLVGLTSVLVITELYSYLAIKGLFGETAQDIAEYQEQFFGSILLGGRPEIVVNIQAFLDSPILGQGALAESSRYLVSLASIGVYAESNVFSNDENIYHSVLFTAAHEAGLLAVLLWAYLAYRLAFAVSVFLELQRKLAFVAIPLLINGIWIVLFSPLISYNRWILSLAIAFAFVAVDRLRAYQLPLVQQNRA